MESFKKALEFMPPRLKRILISYGKKESVCEIRLRKNAPLTLTTFQGNVFIDKDGNETTIDKAVISSREELSAALKLFCAGSVYRFISSLTDGYIVNDDGFRLGLCPDSKFDIESSIPDEYSSISVRIPRYIKNAANGIISHFNECGIHSLLIASLPGAGKTTVLRDLSVRLSKGEINKAKRCAVIDERREIFPPNSKSTNSLCDVISGYPKGKGMEIAIRVFNPEIIFCDEISNETDANGILENIGSGITFIATCHASGLEEAKAKPYMNKLINSGAFDEIAIIKRRDAYRYSSKITFESLL